MNLGYNQKEILEKAILRTIAFFDMFDYPLTPFEIWKYLGVKCKLGEVIEALETDPSQSPLRKGGGALSGFYFLKGREEIVKTRLKRYNYTDRKFKRALRVSKIFKFIPWIQGVAIGNIMGAHNLRQESDIDFFIITQKGRIWIARFFCVMITKILGLRPKPGNFQDKICLSFFVSEDNLNLKSLMLEKQEAQLPIGGLASRESDVYFIHWLACLNPIYDSNDIFNKFFQENEWIGNYFPNWQFNKISFKRNEKEIKVVKVFQKYGSGLDRITKDIQLKRLPAELKNLMNKDSRVIVNDQILKFHSNDRRSEYKDKFLNYKF